MIVLNDILRYIFSLFFILAGISHFTNPEIYDQLVPTYLPSPRFFNLLAGLFEIILGVSLLTKWKSQGALLLAVFLVLLYLGNLHMWINDIPFLGNTLTTSGHIIRLITQIGMIIYSLYLWRVFKLIQ